MENMDKGLTVPKWVPIIMPKIPQKPHNSSAQIVSPSPKIWDFDEKKASVVRGIECGAECLEHDVAQSTFYLPGFYD